jgi:hypothetical protein
MRGYTTRSWKTVLTAGILAPALAAVITPLALRAWTDDSKWAIGTPDLVVRTPDILVKGTAPDWWSRPD